MSADGGVAVWQVILFALRSGPMRVNANMFV